MVTKLILESETPANFKAARVLYTGTGTRYLHEALQEFEEFRHATKEYVCLSDDPLTPMSFALERARFYRDSPVVLAVDTEKLEGDLHYHGDYKARALNMDCFLPYEFAPNGQGQIDENVYSNALRLGEFVSNASREELRALNERFFKVNDRHQ